jgi:ABC-type uncharacterized transport system involved in gliding motility auxiliary subunit
MSKLGKMCFLFAGISLVSMSMTRYLVGVWLPFCWVCLAMAAIFFVIGLLLDLKFFKEFFMMKTTKQGMSMGVLILLVLALLGVINFIGVRHSVTFDFSSAKTNTLSDQSVKLVKNLDSELKVLFFYKKGVEGNEENRRMFRDLIKKYQDESSKIQLEFVEVNERPDIAKEYGVDKGSGVAFLDYKGRRNRVEKIDEQELTSALVKVTREKTKNIYFVIGHGEKDLDEAKEGLGLGALKLMLENNRYTVKPLALAQVARVPTDADIVVIAGPVQQYMDSEIRSLEDYLKSGGSLLMAIESQNTEGLEKIAKKLGIQFENNYVMSIVDTPMGRGINQGPTMGSVFSTTNQITKSFGKGEFTLFRHPQSLKKIDGNNNGYAVDEIVKTPAAAMAFKSLELHGEGPEGSFAIVDQVRGKWDNDPKAKDFSVIIVGDVDFMTNQMLYQNLNRDLTLNSLASLANEQNLISITPKEASTTEMFLTDMKFKILIFAFFLPLPVLLLGTSVGLWLRRRNA